MLHLHRAERADGLVGPLADVLRAPAEDPFAPEVVAVPTRGVERWLAQRLSHLLGTGADGEDGICAHVRFDSPTRMVDRVLAPLLAPDGPAGEAADPWRTDRLTWSVLEVVDACAGEPWCTALGRHLGLPGSAGAGGAGADGAGAGAEDAPRRARRLQAAQHLAHLFTSYAAQRPDMLTAWAAGWDEDGTGAPVPEDLRWQAELWRRVRDRIATPSPAELLGEAVERVAQDPGVVDLPARVSVFGPTRLPEDQLRVLHALARHRDVHLWLPHPSPALWERVAAETGRTAGEATDGTHDTDGLGARRRSAHVVPAEHPLLASMARDATELHRRLSGGTDTHHPAATRPGTLLGALQDRLRDDAPDAPPHVWQPTDRSVQVHACHGRARQVEVLREALLGLFADDPTLEARDVIVLCPDIEAFAPLVAATFGMAPGADVAGTHPGRALRVRLADRSLRQTNPLLALVSRLLELADGRVTASQVVDLAGSEPVRRRFHLDDDALDRIRGWATEAGVRWGEDRARRARFGLEGVAQGTWETALDRVLLGAAMAEEDQRYVGSALPLDDVDSTDVDLAGRLAELVDRLTAVLADLDGEHPAAHWFDALDRALDLLSDVGPAESWQDVEARTALDEARQAAADHAGTPLCLSDVRALLARRLQGRPTRAGFRTGALTVCSLEPMRAVPHRVVALLGMDDGAFPRGTSRDGDDVLLRAPLIGERDRRGEDRQLFLDALTAAGEHLVVVYGGADERTGSVRPPAVPVGELLDALDRTARTPDGRPARDHLVVRHPLQTVDERNFTDGALGRPGPFSFDGLQHAAAVAARGERPAAVPFLAAPLPPLHAGDPAADDDGAGGELDLEDLVRVLEHPVRAFLRTRLGVQLPGDAEELQDRLPLELDGLEKWHVGDRLLAAALDGADLDQAVRAEGRRGRTPPRRLGGTVLEEVRATVVPIVDATRPWAGGTARSVDLTVPLPDGRLLTGTLTGLHGDTLVRAVYSRLAAKHRLRAWVQLLALAASDAGSPERPYRAVTIGRAGQRAAAGVSVLTCPSPHHATRWLAQLVALRDAALREPLPLPVATTCAYARSRHARNDVPEALADAAREWAAGTYQFGEQGDDHHVLVWGEDAALRDVAGTPDAEEATWWPQEGTRLGVLARRVWEPLLEHERTETA